MGNQLVCTICQETSAEFACNCSGNLTRLCAKCLVSHLRDKSKIHTSIDLNSIDRISHNENYHIFSQNILEIGHSLNIYRNDLILFIHNINSVQTKTHKLLKEESTRAIADCNKIIRNVDDNLKKIAEYLNQPEKQADQFIDGFKRNGLNGILNYCPRNFSVTDKSLYDAVKNAFRIRESTEEVKDIDQIEKEKEELTCKVYQMQEIIDNLKKQNHEKDIEIFKAKKEYIREKKLVEALNTEKDSFTSVLHENQHLKSELNHLTSLTQELQQNQEIIAQKDKLLSYKDDLILHLQYQTSTSRKATQPALKLPLGDLDSLSKGLDSRAETSTSFSSVDYEKLYSSRMNEEYWTSKELYEASNISESIFNVLSCISSTYRMKQCPKCKREHKILMWKTRYLVCECLTVIYCDQCRDKIECECGRYEEMSRNILQANMPYRIEFTAERT